MTNNAIIAIALFFGCSKHNSPLTNLPNTPAIDTAKINGTVEKGPFVRGSVVTIFELDSNLDATGKSFKTEVQDDIGSFSIDIPKLSTKYIRISATGIYFNEIEGQLSSSPITLNAILDIEKSKNVHINVLTHLEEIRIKSLLKKEKISFSDAKVKVLNEISKAFFLKIPPTINSDQITIIKNNEDSNILIGISGILLNISKSEKKSLKEVLDKISANLNENGTLHDDFATIVKQNIESLNPALVSSNIQNRYRELNVPLGDFSIDEAFSVPMHIPSKLTSLQYINLGENIRFLGVDKKNLYWFSDKSDNSIAYCRTVSEVMTLNLTKLKSFANLPVLCRELNSGELIVITEGDWESQKKAQIWTSSNHRTNWTMKMTFDNMNNRTQYINSWGFSQFGNRILVSGYGKRYTSDESPSEAKRYSDINDKANYSIYYSPDDGRTWYNRLFNLGDQHPFTSTNPKYKPYLHIHAVSIDPYREELIVTQGDLPVEADPTGQQNRVFRSINLTEWEKEISNGNDPSLKWTSDIAKKFGGIGILPNATMFGSDDIPNGVYTNSRTNKTFSNLQLTFSEDKWKYQRQNGNSSNSTGEYGIWGGYCFHRRNNSQPMYLANLYITGSRPDDYKRCQVIATWDGYKFLKVWESDYDLISSKNIVLPNTSLFFSTDDNNNILIQTNDGRFSPFISDRPQITKNHTLIIAKGI